MDEAEDKTLQFRQKYQSATRSHQFLIDRFFAAVTALLEQAAPTSVLEVGCGPGYAAAAIRESLPEEVPFEASDILPENLEIARQVAPGVPFTVESIYEMSREDASVDAILCLEVLEHLDEPGRALDELLRVSRRHVLLSVPREPVWRVLNFLRLKYVRDWGNTPGHVNHWGRRSFARFVGQRANVVAVRSPFPWTVVLAEKVAP
jgi:ubiquinone/menaquinone biosynthesis C-methylase UbiE